MPVACATSGIDVAPRSARGVGAACGELVAVLPSVGADAWSLARGAHGRVTARSDEIGVGSKGTHPNPSK